MSYLSDDSPEEEREDIVHIRQRRHQGDVVPVVHNLETTEAIIGTTKLKPKESERKIGMRGESQRSTSATHSMSHSTLSTAPTTLRNEFSDDSPEEEKEDIVHMRSGRHQSDVVPVVPNLELAEVTGIQKQKPKDADRKKNISKKALKGQSLTSDDAVAFMIQERQTMDEEFAKLRYENNKLKQDLQLRQDVPVSDKATVDLNDKKHFAELERLKYENIILKKKKDEMEALLKERQTIESAEAKKVSQKQLTRREKESSSESDNSSEPAAERPQKPTMKQQTTVPTLQIQPAPRSEKQRSPKPRPSSANAAKKSPTTGVGSTLPLTGKKFNSLPSILWEGGKLWKVPFNGKGMPEERMVMIKRALRPGPQARPVRVLSKGEESAEGAVAVPVAYIAYPPALIWYNPDKPNEAKFAREIFLVEGAYIVDGHKTPAFWKMVSRGAPMPHNEL